MSGFILKKQLYIIATSFLIFIMTPAILNAENISAAQSRAYREKLVEEAKKYIGVPYVRGATGPDAFDCSGLVYTVSHDAISYQLPRTVKAIYSQVKIIPADQREPGDVVFFRTTGDGSISHIGLYIGNEQFISAVSDGPNTGVILSSLRENYWKNHYAASGKFLPDAGYGVSKSNEIEKVAQKKTVKSEKSQKAEKKSNGDKTPKVSYRKDSFVAYEGNGSFAEHLAFSAYSTVDWSIFTEKKVMPNFRGVSLGGDAIYRGKFLSPGMGFILRWNYGVSAFQIPVIFSLYMNDFFRVYAGPLFSMGNSSCPDSDTKIQSAIFPGVVGATFSFPPFTKGDLKVQMVQDICYSIYENKSNSALSPLKSASSGLEFCTGIRVFFPMSMFSKK